VKLSPVFQIGLQRYAVVTCRQIFFGSIFVPAAEIRRHQGFKENKKISASLPRPQRAWMTLDGTFENTIRKGYTKKKKTVSRRRKIRLLIVFFPDDGGEFIHTDLSSANLQHCAYQSAYHSTQKTVGDYPVNQAFSFLLPPAVEHLADTGFRLGVSFGK